MGITRQLGIDDFVTASTATQRGYGAEGYDPAELLTENPPVYFERNLRSMIAVSNEHDVPIMFSTWAHSSEATDYSTTPHYEQGIREHNQVVKSVAKRHGIPLFDFAPLMPNNSRYWADGRHVNEEGAKIKADLFAAFINEQELIRK